MFYCGIFFFYIILQKANSTCVFCHIITKETGDAHLEDKAIYLKTQGSDNSKS